MPATDLADAAYRAALEERRYADWFAAFIASSDENQRQAEAAAAMLAGLKRRLPALFATSGAAPAMFLDLMCGPGEMTRALKTALQKAGLPRLKACGLELREDHAAHWRETMDAGDEVLVADLATPGLDLSQTLRQMDQRRPAAITVSHGGYYLDPAGSEPASAALAGLIRQAHDLVTDDGLVLTLHKDTEWTDILKRRFGNFVEADTTSALHQIYAQLGIPHHALTFRCRLTIPEVDAAVRNRLTAERLEPYAAMEPGPALKLRQIIEFLVHAPLESIGGGGDNLTARRQLLACAESLGKVFGGAIPTFVNMIVSLPPRAAAGYARTFRIAAADVGEDLAEPGPSLPLLEELARSL